MLKFLKERPIEAPIPNRPAAVAPAPAAAPEKQTRAAAAVPSAPSPDRMIGKAEAAGLCGVAASTWDRYRACGWVPKGIRVGNALRWRAEDIRKWQAAGCPRPDDATK
jgi:predicted DNA-binding transcriptional regulator AlpA